MLRRFWSYYQPYKKLFVLDFSCAVVLAILELSFPLFVNYVVDKLLPRKQLVADPGGMHRDVGHLLGQRGPAVYCQLLGPHAWDQY